jgi:nitrite reductase (NO-forming)
MNIVLFVFIPVLIFFNLNYASSLEKTFSLVIKDDVNLHISPDNALHPGGIQYHAITFNNTIPGPAIVADEGDILQINVKNDGKTTHNIIFKAGLGVSKSITGNIAPGEERTIELKTEKPGAFIYYDSGDAINGIWENVANGLYGGVIIHPMNEKPAKEFYLSFGEIFNTADKGLFVGTDGEVGTFDLTKFYVNQPDLVLTNGMAHKYVPSIGMQSKLVMNENAEVFKVKPNELTRWYIVNSGPRGPVALGFIGTILDSRDGTIDSFYGRQLTSDEVWTIAPGSASVIETIFPEKGLYIGLDNDLGRFIKGAGFVVLATDDSNSEDQPEGTNVAPKRLNK